VPKSKKPGLEAVFSQLESTISRLDNQQLSLEESLTAFEAGLTLVRQAQAELQNAEQRVAALTEEAGQPVPKQFLIDNDS